MRKTLLATAAILTASMALWAAPGAAQEEGLTVGAVPEAPILETLDGEPADLAEVMGEKPVLVEFWATWCAVCRALEPRVRAAHEAYGDRVEFLVVAVGVAQTTEQVRQHMARHDLPGRVLWDGRGAAARAFEAPGTGYIVILDADGKVAYTGTGTDQDLVGALAGVLGD